MKHIDEQLLETDLETRFGYVTGFIGLTEADLKAIHGAAAHLAPLVPGLVNAVYNKLYEQDATWRHFARPQAGYTGPVPEKLEDLTPKAGSAAVNIPIVQIIDLMGFVADAITNTIFSLNLPRDVEIATVRAFGKLLWIQNDLFVRHYVG